ncbi:MAG TPA: HD domain-containing phosphohydrolase [Solirubrobacteraceae bacterium]|nr:HD domain-containing phosphohydrolase [Solirubrobacteraceae bacterium]
MPELTVKTPARPARSRTLGPARSSAGAAVAGAAAIASPVAPRTAATLAGEHERARRAEALRRHRADARLAELASGGELGYLRAQLHVAADLTARLAGTHEIEEMVRLVVDELHLTFAFYLAAVQRLDGDGMLRLVAGAGPLAEVMTEFLLLEQPLHEGVNGRVARSGSTALVSDTQTDPDYIARDPQTDPRSELSAPIFVDGSVWGVINIEAVEPGALGETDAVLVETIAASLGAAIHRAGLLADMERTFTTTLAALTSTVEAKDDYTAAHGEDVAGLAERVARRLGLTRAQARDVRYAAMLHDVGKIAVPSEILLKRGPLTDAEWEIMRGHAAIGGDLVARIDAFAHLASAVRASHERWDGGGYPDGLAGEQIPLAARIIAVCDTYDAIVTERPYRPARTPAQARAELERVAGSQLDAGAVAALLGELAAAES